MGPEFGIYQAVVTDNSQFFVNGKIKVRVQNLYNGRMNWDLESGYDSTKWNNELAKDISALVYTPIGGGSGHGLFSLPQVNSVGLVQFMNGNIKKPIWMGSFFNPIYDNDDKIAKVNVPNDRKLYEGAGTDGIIQDTQKKIGKKNIEGGNGTVVFRTKTTKGPGDNHPENMNFDEQRTENLLVFSDEKLSLTHFDDWEDTTLRGFQEIELGTYKQYDAAGNVVDEYPEITIKIVQNKDKSTEKTSSIKINKNGSFLETTEKTWTNKVAVYGKSIELSSENSNNGKESIVTVKPKQTTIANDKSVVLVSNDEIDVSSSGGTVRLSASKVMIGDGGGYVVVSDVPGFSMRMEDGSVIKASPKVTC